MVRRELERSDLLAPVGRGDDKVSITAGRRSIESMNEVLGTLIAAVKEHGGEPFLFPAMGSHGRGDAAGQVEVLRRLGTTAANVSAPIYSGFDVVEIDRVLETVPVYADRAAVNAETIS